MSISESLKSFFHDEGIHSTTIQPEFIEVNIKDIMRILLVALVDPGFIQNIRLCWVLCASSA